eukprot:TRINITY_DN971_c0_g2_i1.p1 TRINITY_DN971_c0_g2~~TRINITY_DN971_c0_g2_i1.p1  ORF type:complete len:226 (+),score=80.60 TRINITY_DN971_c0_g2_i1:184-861(+)
MSLLSPMRSLLLLLVVLLGPSDVSASLLAKHSSHHLRAHKAVTAHREPAEEGEEDEDDTDEDDEDEDADSNATDVVAVAAAVEQPADEKERLRDNVFGAHEALSDNLQQQVAVNSEIKELDDVEKSHQFIDASVEAVKNETQSPAMAAFLGDMWKEMRMFAKPFYKEHLEEKLAKLEAKTPSLSANFTKAQAALSSWNPQAVDTLDPSVETSEAAVQATQVVSLP